MGQVDLRSQRRGMDAQKHLSYERQTVNMSKRKVSMLKQLFKDCCSSLFIRIQIVGDHFCYDEIKYVATRLL